MYLTISYWFQRGLMDSNKVLCYPGVGQLHQQGPTVGGCSQQGPQREALLLLTDRWAHGLRSSRRLIAKETETRNEKQNEAAKRFVKISHVTDLQSDLKTQWLSDRKKVESLILQNGCTSKVNAHFVMLNLPVSSFGNLVIHHTRCGC